MHGRADGVNYSHDLLLDLDDVTEAETIVLSKAALEIMKQLRCEPSHLHAIIVDNRIFSAIESGAVILCGLKLIDSPIG